MQSNIIFHIQNKLAALPKAEKRLAEWILAHSSEIIHMSVKTLSEQANSSPATIVRLCYSLELTGFTDLKLHLSTILPEINEDLYSDIVKGEEITQIKKKLKLRATHAIDETTILLDDQMLAAAVTQIEEAELIFVCGVGASGLVAEDIYQKLTRIGKNVFFSMDRHLFATALATNTSKSVLFSISNSGETDETIYLAKIAKKNQIPVVGITRDLTSTLGKLVEIVLHTASGEEAQIRSAATSSLLAQFFTIDILFTAYASRNYEEAIEKINQSKDIIKEVPFLN